MIGESTALPIVQWEHWDERRPSARALLSSVRRHLGVVVGLSLLFCLLGAFIGLGLPPRFQAQGVLIIRSATTHIECAGGASRPVARNVHNS